MDNKLITLKEASEISGYSADYIGQLIRAGKITGKQVYTNITWMTTAEAVVAYKNKGKNPQSALMEKLRDRKRIFGLQINVFKMVLQNFPALKLWLSLLLGLFLIFLATLTYFSQIQNNKIINTQNTFPATNVLSY